MECDLKEIDQRLIKLARDVEFIKQILTLKEDDEGELSNWAKEELKKARSTSKSEYISLDDIKCGM